MGKVGRPRKDAAASKENKKKRPKRGEKKPALLRKHESWEVAERFEPFYPLKVSTKGRVTLTLTITNDPDGRSYIRLRGQDIPLDYIVASTYLPNPEGFNKVIHKDGDLTNNSAHNLEWDTTERVNTRVKPMHMVIDELAALYGAFPDPETYPVKYNYIDNPQERYEKAIDEHHDSVFNPYTGKYMEAKDADWFITKPKRSTRSDLHTKYNKIMKLLGVDDKQRARYQKNSEEKYGHGMYYLEIMSAETGYSYCYKMTPTEMELMINQLEERFYKELSESEKRMLASRSPYDQKQAFEKIRISQEKISEIVKNSNKLIEMANRDNMSDDEFKSYMSMIRPEMQRNDNDSILVPTQLSSQQHVQSGYNENPMQIHSEYNVNTNNSAVVKTNSSETGGNHNENGECSVNSSENSVRNGNFGLNSSNFGQREQNFGLNNSIYGQTVSNFGHNTTGNGQNEQSQSNISQNSVNSPHSLINSHQNPVNPISKSPISPLSAPVSDGRVQNQGTVHRPVSILKQKVMNSGVEQTNQSNYNDSYSSVDIVSPKINSNSPKFENDSPKSGYEMTGSVHSISDSENYNGFNTTPDNYTSDIDNPLYYSTEYNPENTLLAQQRAYDEKKKELEERAILNLREHGVEFRLNDTIVEPVIHSDVNIGHVDADLQRAKEEGDMLIGEARYTKPYWGKYDPRSTSYIEREIPEEIKEIVGDVSTFKGSLTGILQKAEKDGKDISGFSGPVSGREAIQNLRENMRRQALLLSLNNYDIDPVVTVSDRKIGQEVMLNSLLNVESISSSLYQVSTPYSDNADKSVSGNYFNKNDEYGDLSAYGWKGKRKELMTEEEYAEWKKALAERWRNGSFKQVHPDVVVHRTVEEIHADNLRREQEELEEMQRQLQLQYNLDTNPKNHTYITQEEAERQNLAFIPPFSKEQRAEKYLIKDIQSKIEQKKKQYAESEESMNDAISLQLLQQNAKKIMEIPYPELLATIGGSMKNRKRVCCTNIYGEERVFNSMREAAAGCNVHESQISKCCRGIINTVHGMRFRYVDIKDIDEQLKKYAELADEHATQKMLDAIEGNEHKFKVGRPVNGMGTKNEKKVKIKRGPGQPKKNRD